MLPIPLSEHRIYVFLTYLLLYLFPYLSFYIEKLEFTPSSSQPPRWSSMTLPPGIHALVQKAQRL